MMVDVPLIVEQLRKRGYTVTHTAKLAENAGEYEFEVNGEMLVLAEVNALLEGDTNVGNNESMKPGALAEQESIDRTHTLVNGLPEGERKG